MALAFDAGSGGTAIGANSLTYSHTVGVGSERILLVGINFFAADAADDVTGVTYAGVSMTQIAKQSIIGTNQQWSYLYYLIAPATGANNVVISKTTNDDIRAASASYTGADQTAQPDAFTTDVETSSIAISTALTTVADNCWVVNFAMNSNATIEADTGTTARDISQTFCGIGDNGSAKTPAGSVTMGWKQTPSGAAWTVVMASIQPPIPPPSGSPGKRSLLGVGI